MNEMDKCYNILGLNPGASEDEIKDAYQELVDARRLAWIEHPNMQIGEELKEKEEAYKKLLSFIARERRQNKKGEEKGKMEEKGRGREADEKDKGDGQISRSTESRGLIDRYYQILGLNPGASEGEVIQAYKVLSKTLSPDKFPNDPDMQRLASEKIREIDKAFKAILLSTGGQVTEEKQVGNAKLSVKSEPPGAKIYVNGKEVGVSPVTFSHVRPGRYLVRVVKEEYEPYEQKVEVETGDVKVVDASLRQTLQTGDILIRSEPLGAEIFLDGQPIGVTHCQRSNLLQGSHSIRIKKEGYEVWESTTIVQPGKTEEVFIKLIPKKPKSGDVWKDPYLGMEFIFVKGGEFEMGDVFGDGYAHERVHKVSVDNFLIGRFEVTQGEWKRVMGNNPSRFKKGNNYPVETVSWNDVQEFIQGLNQKTSLNFRLPTEAEWEYAARSGGKREKWAGTNKESNLEEYAWYRYNSGAKTHPVGQKLRNELGLRDMSGNVFEWVEDCYDRLYYQDNPGDKQDGTTRVIRGGGWYSEVDSIRTTHRGDRQPHLKDSMVGFRLVRSIKEGEAITTVISSLSSDRDIIPEKSTQPLVGTDQGKFRPPGGTGAAMAQNGEISLGTALRQIGKSTSKQGPQTPSKSATQDGLLRGTPDAAGNTRSEEKQDPSGVGGWLMLLVIGMMVFGPLLGAGSLDSGITKAEVQYPGLKSLAEWGTYKNVEWCLFFVFAVISFYGGWGLCRRRDWSVVSQAKTILWVTQPGAAILLVIIIPPIIFGKTGPVDPAFIGAFFASVIFVSIWTVYLSKSKRVRNTYGGSESK